MYDCRLRTSVCRMANGRKMVPPTWRPPTAAGTQLHLQDAAGGLAGFVGWNQSRNVLPDMLACMMHHKLDTVWVRVVF